MIVQENSGGCFDLQITPPSINSTQLELDFHHIAKRSRYLSIDVVDIDNDWHKSSDQRMQSRSCHDTA